MSSRPDTDLPFIKLYTGEYRRLTAGLSLTEKGAFFELVLFFWDRGIPIPDDDIKLARILGISVKEWIQLKPSLLEFCFESSEGKLRQGYFESHRVDSAELHEKNVQRARKAAKARYSNDTA